MKLKPYPKYRDSGVPWLGDVPEHWEIKALRTILKQRNEKNDPIKTEQILSLSIAHGVTLYSHEGRGGNKSKGDLTAYKIAIAGDIVLNSMNVVVGAVGLSKHTGAISPVYYALHPISDEIDIRFYEKIFKNKFFQKFLMIYGKGILIKKSSTGKFNTIRMKISSNDLKGTVLPLPPLCEQQQIARYLDWKTAQINKFIRNKRRLIQLLKEQKQNIINQAVTKGINPNVEMKDSGVEWLGQIPAHWEVRRLKYISSVNKETLPDSTDPDYLFYYVDIGCVSTGTISKKLELLKYSNAPSRARRVVSKGDTIISTVRTYLKAIYHFEHDVNDIIVSTGFAVFTPVGIYPKMLGYLLRFDGFIDQVIRLSVGASYPAVNTEHLCTIPVAFPEDVHEQELIIDYIENKTASIDKAIARTEREIELIQEYRTRLISDVVTGKLDVRGIEVPEVIEELLMDDEDLTEVDDIMEDEEIDEEE